MFFALKVSLLPFCQPMSFITSAFLMPKPHLIGWVIIGCKKKPRKTKRNTIFLVMKMHRKVSSAKWRPFCPRVFYLQSTKFSSPLKGACHLAFIHVATIVMLCRHDDVIKWKHFPRYRPFVRGIHLSLVNYPHKGQWRGVLVFSLICVWTNGWVNNRSRRWWFETPSHPLWRYHTGPYQTIATHLQIESQWNEFEWLDFNTGLPFTNMV